MIVHHWTSDTEDRAALRIGRTAADGARPDVVRLSVTNTSGVTVTLDLPADEFRRLVALTGFVVN